MTDNPTLNKKVPNFNFVATSELTGKLSDYKGKKIVLYFYPKDSTPGCTKESEGFRDHHLKFKRHNTIIFGISRDTLKSHEKFKDKLGLPFELISDEEASLCQLFDVIKLKNMYGKKVRGIERSTFLIDETGKLVGVWRKVKVDGHVEAVLEALTA